MKAKSAYEPGGPPGRATRPELIPVSIGEFLFHPGWDASPSQGYSLAFSSPVPIFKPGWRECLAQEHNTMSRSGLEPGPLDPETSALTM